MIPQSFIQELLGRVDIVDVIDRHVKLKRAGANHAACCPFHNEKTPSFTVSQAKQFYHCFGCGAHGTAIGFLMEYSGLGFVEAVKELAQGVGLKVPESRAEPGPARAREAQDLTAVLLRAAQFYRSRLKDAPGAIAYLRKRGLSGEVAKHFGIGYAPDGWQNLAAAFSDYDGEPLAAAGLVKQNEEGRRYDVFRNRIVFPIVDLRGNVIGFGGRVLEAGGADSAAQGSPKYLNSPESPVFEKGRELYGLYQARRAIRESGRVVVVEGYMDVVALAQAGIGNAVATLGTATTPVHVQKLLRQTDEVVFCFDGDSAGRRAAWRALEVSLAHLQDGKQVKFLFLPDGEDPDTYVRGRGRAEFERLLAAAQPLSRFLLDDLAGRHDLASAEGRAALIHAARPLLRQLPAGALRLQLARELAERGRSTPEEVTALCELGPSTPPRAAPPRAPTRPVTPLGERLVRLLLSDPACAAAVTPAERELLDAPGFAPVAELIDLLKDGGCSTPAMLIEATRDSPHAALYRSVAGESLTASPEDPGAADAFAEAFRRLEHDRVKGEFERLNAAGPLSDAERQRFHALIRRLAELKGASRAGVRQET
ncbi:MAG: DNA primase [Burkholderiales bacterium]|nr:DNA primase [Burkholderiales bacterium]